MQDRALETLDKAVGEGVSWFGAGMPDAELSAGLFEETLELLAAVGEEGLSLEEVVVPTESKLVGKTVLDSNLKNQYGVTIIGIKRGGEKMTLNPEPGTILGAGDILILIGRVDQLELLNHSVKL